ncbi:MAG TPA: N-acetylmuramoyl-L-alanine amidase [Xanthomonadales bacterium]|nr:N-acetylmuramoyl-L-alanine amidase [Xanthomonadales bacterium]
MKLRPLPYEQQLDLRPPSAIDLVVIHCTELPDLETARSYGEAIHYLPAGTGNSGHFYLDREGNAQQWVDPARIAHHVRAYNERSIGIELVNRGRYPDWLHSERQTMQEPYPDAQVQGLLNLLHSLCTSFNSLRWIAGHEDLDSALVPAANDPAVLVRRKCDPGPLFPWERVAFSVPLRRLR